MCHLSCGRLSVLQSVGRIGRGERDLNTVVLYQQRETVFVGRQLEMPGIIGEIKYIAAVRVLGYVTE